MRPDNNASARPFFSIKKTKRCKIETSKSPIICIYLIITIDKIIQHIITLRLSVVRPYRYVMSNVDTIQIIIGDFVPIKYEINARKKTISI